MSLAVDNDLFDYNLITPTPRASNFPPIVIPVQSYPTDALSPYSSPDNSNSPYSSPSPQTDYSTNTSLSMSPNSLHLDLPQDIDLSQDVDQFPPNLNFAAPLSKSPKARSRSRSNPPPRKGDPSYIPRPENAFILFRKDAVAKIRAAEAAEADQIVASNDKGEKGKRQRQADMSKYISHLWKALSRQERAEWEEQAAKIKREHEAKHPDYRYQPSRPGANLKRSATATKGKSRTIRNRSGFENDDGFSSVSEDLSIVVRPTRGPRRSSVCSTASSVSTNSMSLPSVPSFSRPTSPYNQSPYQRPSQGSRQWVQPPAEDPSPPPSELFFPRGSVPYGLDKYNGGLMALESSLTSEPESEYRPTNQRRRNSHVVQSNRSSPREDQGTVFVEPITSERNPWTPGGSKYQSSRRAGGRSNRPRSYSQPIPLQLNQASPIDVDDEPSFEVNIGWTPETPAELAEVSPKDSDGVYRHDSRGNLSSPWIPQSGFSHQSPLAQLPMSSPESDCHTDFGALDLTSEEWMSMLEPHHLDLASFVDDHTGMFGFQAFESQTDDDEDDLNRPYTVVNLDEEGRPRSFF